MSLTFVWLRNGDSLIGSDAYTHLSPRFFMIFEGCIQTWLFSFSPAIARHPDRRGCKLRVAVVSDTILSLMVFSFLLTMQMCPT